MTQGDLARAADYLEMSTAEFEKKYVYRTSNLMRLRVPRLATCPFLKEYGCSIHPAKPTQCGAFPFWPEMLESRREWSKASRYCPGMNKGPLIQIGHAREVAENMRQAYPSQYPKPRQA